MRALFTKQTRSMTPQFFFAFLTRATHNLTTAKLMEKNSFKILQAYCAKVPKENHFSLKYTRFNAFSIKKVRKFSLKGRQCNPIHPSPVGHVLASLFLVHCLPKQNEKIFPTSQVFKTSRGISAFPRCDNLLHLGLQCLQTSTEKRVSKTCR